MESIDVVGQAHLEVSIARWLSRIEMELSVPALAARCGPDAKLGWAASQAILGTSSLSRAVQRNPGNEG